MDPWNSISWAGNDGVIEVDGRRFKITRLSTDAGIYAVLEQGVDAMPVTVRGSLALSTWIERRLTAEEDAE